MFLFNKNSDQTSVGIDIGSTSIKIVQLKKVGEDISIDTYGELPLGPYAGLSVGQAVRLGDLKLVEAINDLYKAAKVTSKQAVIGIEPSASFVTSVFMPVVSPEELKTMMPLEARRYIPIPLSEVKMDFWPVPGHINRDVTPNTQEVIIAAVKNDTLALYDRVATKLELENVEFEVQGFSVLRSCIPESNNLVLSFDYGGEYSTICLSRGGVVLDMHVIPRGAQDGTMQISRALAISIEEAELLKRNYGYHGDKSHPFMKEVLELASYPLFGELARLIIMHERKYNQDIEGVVLVGGGSRIKGVLDMYHKATSVPVRIADPFQIIKTPAYLRDIIRNVGPTYAVAVGLALKKLTK